MRHERSVTALLVSVAAVSVFATGCSGEEGASASRRGVATSVSTQTANLASDTVSGCMHGAGLVKVLIDLRTKNDHCVAEVTPASVCVAPGGVVRFKVQNGCGDLTDPSRPAVEISQPRFKRLLTTEPPIDTPQLLQSCVPRVERISSAGSQVILCDVASNAVEGFYKYDLRGQIETLDPDIEVRN